MLSDIDIKRRLEEGTLSISPLEDPELQIQPATVDFRLGEDFLEFDIGNISCIDPQNDDLIEDYTTETHVPEGEKYILHAGDFVLGTTKERLEMPPDLLGLVNGRSSLGRVAVVIHATSGVVNPGYNGELTLELSNLGNAPVVLRPGMRIAQLAFYELSSTSERPYSERSESKFHNQSGPRVGRVDENEQ